MIEPHIETQSDGICSLLLPYDFLKTPGTKYKQSSISFSINKSGIRYTKKGSQLKTSDYYSYLIACCTSLFYRYSGQKTIPLQLIIADYGFVYPGTTQIMLNTSGKDNFEALIAQIDQFIEINTSSKNVHKAKTFAYNQSDIPVAITLKDVAASNTDPSDWLDEIQKSISGQDVHNDLDILMTLTDHELMVRLVYNLALFQEGTIDRMTDSFKTLLSEADAGIFLCNLPLLAENEQHWLADMGKGEKMALPQSPVHVEIERHAMSHPDQIAVKYNDDTFTYEKLNRLANQLAHYIRQQGVRSGHRVVVFVEPGFDIIVTLLAIFKSGVVYVPLDPGYPSARINTILEDTAPSLIVTQSHLVGRLDTNEARVVAIDNLVDVLEKLPDENIPVDFKLQQTAYIYYTSGTTGKPKGIMATHANLLNYIWSAKVKYAFNSRDIMPAMARYTFSISMFELISPLAAGGTLQILDREHILDLESMMQTLQEVTVIHVGPSLLKNLVKYIQTNFTDYKIFANLRHLSSGGDMIPVELLQSLQQLFPGTELYVIYGCSEISCMGCTWFVDPDQQIVKTFVGTPMANTQMVVVDDYDNLVPAGVTGDVCFAGEGIVRGYLNQDKLTSEKFYQRNGLRYYRTGDRGRWSYQGQLELLGRRDFQVKLRGMRIELGEIEYHLRNAKGVIDGVVSMKKLRTIDNVLIAYYVTDSQVPVSSDDIRIHMRQQVPDYMVPGYYIKLDSLPLNHNMKVDRNALPEPDLAGYVGGLSPKTETEIKLAELWSRLLGHNHILLEDNFFEIGGHSLLAMSMIGELKKSLGITLSGLDILRESLGVLASICDAQLGINHSSEHIQSVIKTIPPVEHFFFGKDNFLYGIHHHPMSKQPESAVLICPPVGNDYRRCHFLLNNLANHLASLGIHVLRFDYFGTSNSLGSDRDASLAHWYQDQQQALEELQTRSQNCSVTVLGVRMGATLAVKLMTNKNISKLVLWDPIVDGESHYKESLDMHTKNTNKLRILNNFRQQKFIAAAKQLLGFTYSDIAINELKAINIAKTDDQFPLPIHWLAIDNIDSQQRTFANMALPVDSKFEVLDTSCDWYAPSKLNDAITDSSIINKILKILLKIHS